MEKVVIHYGCYLQMECEIIDRTGMTDDEVTGQAYWAAIELTDGWIGSQGFDCDCATESEEDWELEHTYGECCRDMVEYAAEYYWEEYNEEKHREFE